MATKTARLLKKATIEGVDYQPDQLIDADVALVKSLVKSDTVDDAAAAVKYCLSNGAKVITHQSQEDKQAAEAAKQKSEAEAKAKAEAEAKAKAEAIDTL